MTDTLANWEGLALAIGSIIASITICCGAVWASWFVVWWSRDKIKNETRACPPRDTRE